MSINEETIQTALKSVVDANTGKDLIRTRSVKNIKITGSDVSLDVELGYPAKSQIDGLRSAVIAALKTIPGIGNVSANVFSKVVTHAVQKGVKLIPGVKNIIAVASGKGGVGKSTTACNLALALSAQGLKVGLLDADIYGPSVPKLFGLSGKPKVIEERLLAPMDGYGIKVMSIGFLIEPETAMIWRGPMVQSAITQMLREVAWGELDILVVDMPPGTGDAQLTMAQATPLSGAVIVSTPQDLALIDARRGVTMFRKVAVPILGVIENMATFVCPNCGHSSHIFGHGGARAEAARLDVPFLGEIPLNMTIRETSDAGRPVVAVDPDGPQAQIYRTIAAQLWSNLSGGPATRAAPRIVIE